MMFFSEFEAVAVTVNHIQLAAADFLDFQLDSFFLVIIEDKPADNLSIAFVLISIVTLAVVAEYMAGETELLVLGQNQHILEVVCLVCPGADELGADFTLALLTSGEQQAAAGRKEACNHYSKNRVSFFHI